MWLNSLQLQEQKVVWKYGSFSQKKIVSKFVELDDVAVQVGHKKLKHGLWK